MALAHSTFPLPFSGSERLVPLAERVRFAAGTRIFQQGRRAGCFWVITHGSVHLELHVPERRPAVVETVHTGELLGWGSMVPPYSWFFTGVAVSPVEALAFDAADVRQLCETDADLGLSLARHAAAVVARRLRNTHARLIALYVTDNSASWRGSPE
jgi:CRP-like cAMP-binding protein